MNERLQKKCVIASAGLHLTLLVVLFLGSGFLGSRKPDDMQLLEFVPMTTTDALVSGGGNPNAKPPPSNPQPPTPQPRSEPQPQPVRQPDPPKTPVRTEKPDPSSLETKPNKKPTKPNVSLKPWKPTTAKPAKPTTSPNKESDAQAQPGNRPRTPGGIASNLKNSLSTSTSVELPGPGGGGLPYANWQQAVTTIYARAWSGTVPDGATDVNTSVLVSVTIARDGSVISARIVQPAGKSLVDKSVQSLLDRVRQTVPFPESSKDQERTVEFRFRVNLPALQG